MCLKVEPLDIDKILDVCSSFSLRPWQVIRLYELFVLNKSFFIDLPRQVGKTHFVCAASILGALIVYRNENMRRAIFQSKYAQFIDKKKCYLSKTFNSQKLPHSHIIIYDEVPPDQIDSDTKKKHIVACIYSSPEKDRQGLEANDRERYLGPDPYILTEKIKSLEEEIRILQAAW